jgi:hypothetical protein
VYVAVMLMLVSPPSGVAASTVCEALSVPACTLASWRSWWGQDFPSSSFWQSARERFRVPVTIARLPQSLLESFEEAIRAQPLVQLLRFISPLSTRAVSN